METITMLEEKETCALFKKETAEGVYYGVAIEYHEPDYFKHEWQARAYYEHVAQNRP